jgi:hypothetical protein
MLKLACRWLTCGGEHAHDCVPGLVAAIGHRGCGAQHVITFLNYATEKLVAPNAHDLFISIREGKFKRGRNVWYMRFGVIRIESHRIM